MTDVTIYSEAFCKLRDDFNKMIEQSLKSEVKGKFDEECELTWDPAGQRHLLVPIGQLPLASEYEREDDDE